MPAGDPQRVWFPEMIAKLRTEWRDALTPSSMIELRDSLDSMLGSIRSERGIQPPVFQCSKCGLVARAAEPHISVRAMILSLGRFGITSREQVKTLEKTWAAYRKKNNLDLYGKATIESPPPRSDCGHSGGIR